MRFARRQKLCHGQKLGRGFISRGSKKGGLMTQGKPDVIVADRALTRFWGSND